MWWLPAHLHISSATETGICMHSWASSFDSCTAGHTWISVETCNVHHSHISTNYHTSLSTAAINTHGSTKGSFVWKTFKNRFFRIIHHYTIYFQTHMKTSWKHIVNSLIHHKPFHIIWTGQLNFVTRLHFTAWTAPHRVICIFIVFYKPHMLLHVTLCNLCSLLWPVVLYLLCLHLIQFIILYYAAKWNKPLI